MKRLKKYGHVDSNDEVEIWINGDLVYQHDVKRAWITGQDSFELVTQTKEELNHCLVKITQSVGSWEFSLIFSDEGHKNIVNLVRWSSDRETIVTASNDHTAKVWNELNTAKNYLLSKAMLTVLIRPAGVLTEGKYLLQDRQHYPDLYYRY